MNATVPTAFRHGQHPCLVILLVWISFFPMALAAQNEARGRKEYAKAFDEDVFLEWGKWKQSPDQMPYYPAGSVYAYLACMSEVRRIAGDEVRGADEESPQLPNTLVISPGTYRFRDKAFELREEGLYRFLDVGNQQEQRIVYENDLDALLSAIAWIVSHGNSDHVHSPGDQTELAKTRKLFMNCGGISPWGKHVLAEQGIRSRVVQSATLGHHNTYDNGHVMLEVYRDDMRAWILYDLDSNCYFTRRGTPLSLIEFAYAVNGGHQYEIVPLANDTRLDVSNFKGKDDRDYAFVCERLNAGPRQWYRRVMQVPFIDGTFFDQENRQRIEDLYPSRKYIDKAEFHRTFYVAPGPS